jgi:hypothetical protein
MENGNQKPNLYKLYQDIGEMKGVLTKIDERLTAVCENYESRLNEVESSVSNMKGKAVIISAVVGFVCSLILVVMSWAIGLLKSP